MMFFSRAGLVVLSFLIMASTTLAHPRLQRLQRIVHPRQQDAQPGQSVETHLHHGIHAARQTTNKLVFAHFMIGIVADRKGPSDYDADMQRAKSYGIDAFALNIGTDPYTDTQLQYAYQSAANNGMKVFISFDFNWWSVGSGSAVGQKIAQYAGLPAQLMVDGKAFASSFIGDGLDVTAMRNAAGRPVYWAPNFSPYSSTGLGSVDAALNWMGWPSNGANRAPTPGNNVSVSVGDKAYMTSLGSKDYIAPASPWFFTHYGPEVSYSKNWLFPGELLWYQRWTELLTMGNRFVEIVSWNDYGESHYVGPLSSPHNDDGASKWVNDMPHNGFLDMAKPFIAAFKAGATSPTNFITSDQVVYWHRPHMKNVNVDSTDNCGSAPNGVDTVSDSVFVVTLLRSAATLTVTSGGQSYTYNAPAGAASFQVPMSTGQQSFSVTRNGQSVVSGSSPKQVVNTGICGMYNFNAYVGVLPPNFNDGLLADGIDRFTSGLKNAICNAQSIFSSFSVTENLANNSPSVTITGSSAGPTDSAGQQSSPTTFVTATATPSASANSCNAGSGPDNYSGLCSFACQFGYCPAPCTCTSTGSITATVPATLSGVNGAPASGLDSSYSGLCSFACSHGYCPGTACSQIAV